MSDMKLIDTLTEIITHGIMDEAASTNIAINVAAAARSHYIPDGYCVVPVEPTDEDFKRGVRAFQSGFNGTDNLSDWKAFWQAMIGTSGLID